MNRSDFDGRHGDVVLDGIHDAPYFLRVEHAYFPLHNVHCNTLDMWDNAEIIIGFRFRVYAQRTNIKFSPSDDARKER